MLRKLGIRALFHLVCVVFIWLVTGCGSTQTFVANEASSWSTFAQVIEGPLNPGIQDLPAPVRAQHCYRVILATSGTQAPLLRFREGIDADSVGFPIVPLERRGPEPNGAALSVFGFCSRGTGTIQLQANMPANGFAALYEAPFSSLSPSHGRDVIAVHDWLQRQRQEAEARARRQREEQRAAAMQQFAQSVEPELQSQLTQLLRQHGRYVNEIFDVVRSATTMRESFVLEPGQCYIFGVLPHPNTQVRVGVLFARVRNSVERTEVERAVTYSVCTAPSGPAQEVTMNVDARVVQGSPTPPAFAVHIAHRRPSAAERRTADREWVSSDPEARIQQ